jgi:beta-phosphoglucomutase-like phosphatase (HAD superfamily)
MKLIIFDVDGTLVSSNGIDDVCFVEAVKEVLDIHLSDTDWFRYSLVTDSGITAEIIKKHLSREAHETDIIAVRQAYVMKLKREIERNPHCFQLIPGASELFSKLRLEENICACIATGGWRDSALLKLATTGINTENIPFASSDDSCRREEILSLAYKRALIHRRYRVFDRVMYVADHVEDFENSRKLGFGFIGIGNGEQALDFKRRGVVHVKPDFVEVDQFMRILNAKDQ